MGAEAIKKLLCEIDLEELSKELKEELVGLNSGQKRLKLLKRLEIVEAFRQSGMDDSGRCSGYSAGHSSDGYVGRRTVRNL